MTQKVLKTCILFFLFSILLNLPAIAQQSERKQATLIANKAIKDLKDGALVVRLKSKSNKISKLEELIASPDVKESSKNKLRKELKTTIEERNKYNVELVKAMSELYTFSKVYYMYDTHSKALKNGTRSGIFLNENLEEDPKITLRGEHFFVLKTGTTDSESTTGLEALIIMDNQLVDLKRPFPYYVRINSIGRLFVRIFNPKKLVQKDAKEIVGKLEAQLNKFYEETTKPSTI